MKINKILLFTLLILSIYTFAGDKPAPEDSPVDIAFGPPPPPPGSSGGGPPPPPPSPINDQIPVLFAISLALGFIYFRNYKKNELKSLD